AKFTGEVGVCIATSGPGAVHLLNGLYDAKMDHQPVVAIVGQQGRVSLGSDAQQQLNLERVFEDVAGYVQTVTTPMQAPLVVDRAVRIAAARRCPTVVVLPADVQDLKMEQPAAEHWVSRTGVGYTSTAYAPPDADLLRAADVLTSGPRVTTTLRAPLVVDRAVRIGAARRCPTAVVLPADVQDLKMEQPAAEHWVSRTGVGYTSTAYAPPEADLIRAADVLNSGSRVTMMVGEGARGAREEIIAVAERLGAGITTALLGKDVVPGDLPYHTQQLGLLGSRPSYDMMQDCDTLLMVGTNFPYAEFLPKTGQARGVQIDLSPANLSLRYPMEVNLAGDAQATLSALLPHLQEQTDRSWQEHVIEGMKDWAEVTEREAMAPADPINPRYVYHLLDERLPDNSIVTADAGSTADWYGHHLKLRGDMRGNLSGSMASMLASMPYALAAKFAYSERPVICTIGDGAFQMLGMNEMFTVKRHWESWADPRFIVMILNNRDLTQVSWEMREEGDPRYDTSQLVEDMDYGAFAELLGLRG